MVAAERQHDMCQRRMKLHRLGLCVLEMMIELKSCFFILYRE